ncbi:unnamed protein product [Paramecium primaurelia]|uniref:Protein kinase domain-containing protein n=1 Tax=Paramecium primaurelia TaxID=5886 RepID=A0A8S1LH83_PARPR|nr:unnamed protein product [Paramecium primaurelia]
MLIGNDQNFQCNQLLQKDSIFNDGIALWLHQDYDSSQPIDQQKFKIESDSKNKIKQLTLYEKYIRYSQHKIILFENSFLDLIHNSQNKLVGFKLVKYDGSLTIIGECKLWIKKLKKYVIQSDFSRNYKISKKIGNGTFADVYLVKHKLNNKEYAAKIFYKKKIILEDQQILMLNKEVQITRLFSNPNICQLYEVFECKVHLTLIMDLLAGSELVYSLKLGGLSEIQSILIIKPLFQALSLLHKQGIFHRDIKPQNIMLHQSGKLETACIIDFGLADFWNDKNEYLFSQCGTPGYVAPEILLGHSYDFKVDVYSLGLVLYLILTGKEPFQSKTMEGLIEENTYGHIALSHLNLSPNCLDFLSKVLAKSPNQRLTSQEALFHPFLLLGPGNHLDLIHNKIQSHEQFSSKSLQFRKSVASVRLQTDISNNQFYQRDIFKKKELERKKIQKQFSIRKVKL